MNDARFIVRLGAVMLGVFVLVGAWSKLPVLGGIAAVIVGAVTYGLSLRARPHRQCRTCGGTGRLFGQVFTYSHAQCPSCGGQTRHRRWGTQLFYGSTPTRAERRRNTALGRRARPR